MKIIIDYDFMNAIKDASEPYSPFKIVRNRQKLYTNVILPISLVFNLGTPVTHMVKSYCGTTLFLVSFETLFTFMLSAANKSEVDMFKEDADSRLIALLPRFNNMDVKTNYKMLLDSKLSQTKYKVDVNENKVPILRQNKLILVPSYDFSGEVIETPVMQDHVVGATEYVLSINEPYEEERRLLTK